MATATINHICKEESPVKPPLPHAFLSALAWLTLPLHKGPSSPWDASAKPPLHPQGNSVECLGYE